MLTNLIDETLGAFPRVAQIGVDFSGPDCLLGAVLLKKNWSQRGHVSKRNSLGFDGRAETQMITSEAKKPCMESEK